MRQSILGANVQSCCERYRVTRQTLLGNGRQTTDDICKTILASKHYGRAMAILELLMIKCSVLDVSDCHFSGHVIDVVVDFICPASLCDIVIFFFVVIRTLCMMFILIKK